MSLPAAPAAYSQEDQAALRRALEEQDDANHKRRRDLELGSERFIVRDEATGLRYRVAVISGVLQAVAL